MASGVSTFGAKLLDTGAYEGSHPISLCHRAREALVAGRCELFAITDLVVVYYNVIQGVPFVQRVYL